MSVVEASLHAGSEYVSLADRDAVRALEFLDESMANLLPSNSGHRTLLALGTEHCSSPVTMREMLAALGKAPDYQQQAQPCATPR